MANRNTRVPLMQLLFVSTRDFFYLNGRRDGAFSSWKAPSKKQLPFKADSHGIDKTAVVEIIVRLVGVVEQEFVFHQSV